MLYIYCPQAFYNYFYHIIESFSYEFKNLGYANDIVLKVPNKLAKNDTVIIFGFQTLCHPTPTNEQIKEDYKKLIDYKKNKNVNPTYILYNSEQLEPAKWWDYILSAINALPIDKIWDYSNKNIEYFKKKGVQAEKLRLVRIGYSKTMTSKVLEQMPHVEDSTFVFFGTMNTKRINTIEFLKFTNDEIKIDTYDGKFFDDYDLLLLKYQKFLNIHYYNNAILEVFRIFPLLANNKIVISEYSSDKELDDLLSNYVIFIKDITEPLPSYILANTNTCKNIKDDNTLSQAYFFKESNCVEDFKMQQVSTSTLHKEQISTLEIIEDKEKNKFYHSFQPPKKHNIKLSILIPSVPQRIEQLKLLIENIQIQIQRLCADPKNPEIELIVDLDNRIRTIGSKRNNLIKQAQGQYVVFVDDDDDITNDYVSSLFNKILTIESQNKINDIKVIVFDVNVFDMDINVHKICKYGVEYKWKDSEEANYREPNHIMCIRNDIAKRCIFKDTSYTEDYYWSLDLKKLLLQNNEEKEIQVRIPKMLYTYNYKKKENDWYV